jgi:hypothetical protein
VIAQLWRSTGGSWPALIAALYAGALPAVPLSVLVGAVHYVSFCTTRRALASVTKADSEARSSGSSQQHGDTSQPLLEQQQHAHAHQHVIVTHGVTGTHFMPMEDPAAAADEQPDDTSLQDSSSKSGKSSSSSTHHTAATAAKGSTPAAAAELDEAEERPISHDVGRGSMALNMACAVITAVITAVVEAPLEQFRHNSQAGNIKGNFVREMWRVRAAVMSDMRLCSC